MSLPFHPKHFSLSAIELILTILAIARRPTSRTPFEAWAILFLTIVLLAIAAYPSRIDQANAHLLELIASSESHPKSWCLFVISAAVARAMLGVATLPIKKAAAIRFGAAVSGASALRGSYSRFFILWDGWLCYWSWRQWCCCRCRENIRCYFLGRWGCIAKETTVLWHCGCWHHDHWGRSVNSAENWLLLSQ